MGAYNKKLYISKGTSHKHKFALPNIKRPSATGSCSAQRARSSGSCLTDTHANCEDWSFGYFSTKRKVTAGLGARSSQEVKVRRNI